MNEIIKIVNDDYHGDLINNDDHNVEDTRNKLKEYRNEIAKNIN